VKWYGDRVKRKMERAARIGINRTMGEAVAHGKANHEWNNRTGTAERSMRIQEPAQTVGGKTSGTWGSVGVVYFIWLERGSSLMKGFGTLRKAAAATYRNLSSNIRRAYTA